jgi:ATP-dependent protease Clp ATPase subunit
MKLVPTNQNPNCTFCHKSRLDVAKLIASPDQHTFICNECTVLPDRLALFPEQIKKQSSSKLRMFFTRIDCSFCKNKVKPSRLYQSARDTQSRSRICKSCLSVCRQILADEARESSSRTKTLKVLINAVHSAGRCNTI